MCEVTQYSCVTFSNEIYDLIYTGVKADPNFAKPFWDKYLYDRNAHPVFCRLCNYPDRPLPGIKSNLYYNPRSRFIKLYTPIPESDVEYELLDDEMRKDVDWVRKYSLNGVDLRTLKQCSRIFGTP